MPKVGNKHFPYTAKGKAAAKKASKAQGRPMTGTMPMQAKGMPMQRKQMNKMMGGKGRSGKK